MSIFTLSQALTEDYKNYVRSFFNIADDRIRAFVEEQLFQKDTLWPEALLQLNPSYETAATVQELCAQGRLHPLCGEIFCREGGQPLRLYFHQRAAIERALARRSFVITSGTGSGKTLTYLIPIFDAVLQNNPAEAKVRAFIVYPMNALVNSQCDALHNLKESFERRTGRELPVRFARYTGQEDEATRDRILKEPPHILLTNYMMLELILVRPQERRFVDRTVAGIEFLVFDELHTYRGRQGADVALLIRRLRERCANPELVCIGTSATMVAGEGMGGLERRQTVAEFASKVFGIPVDPNDVVEERFSRLTAPGPFDRGALRRAVEAPVPQTVEGMRVSPVTAWIEQTFGVEEEPGGSLRRARPITLTEGARKLAQDTGLNETICLDRLREMLLKGSQLKLPDDNPLFALKLHQFISQGRAVYATLEPPPIRSLTLEGQYYAPESEKTVGEKGRILYPLEFCRACGREYYAVWKDEDNRRLLPREPQSDAFADGEATAGYLILVDEDDTWSVEHVPPEWFDAKGRVKRDFRKYIPHEIWVESDGSFAQNQSGGSIKAWFLPKPFMLCLSCGEFYSGRDKNEFRKLARLSSEGRSSATTVMSLSALKHVPEGEIKEHAQKVLSFTDNRQDASLQAGHFNDFVRVSLLRAALLAALEECKEVRYDVVADKVLQYTGLGVRDVAENRELEPTSPKGKDVWKTFRDLLEYRLYEDLQRGWRVVQPNLEQCGLLRIDYLGLAELAADQAKWEGIIPFAALAPDKRHEILRVFLDHFRRKLAINAPCLRETEQQQLQKRVEQEIAERWRFEEKRLWLAQRFLLSPTTRGREISGLSLGERSVIGRYLRRELGLPPDLYWDCVNRLVDLLCAQGLLERGNESGVDFVQLDAAAIIWRLGDGTPLLPDPVYSRRVESPVYLEVQRRTNEFFHGFYRTAARQLQRMEGREHTAQISYEKRQEREIRFRDGTLPCLFCSPTMELGIDIADLQIVHMRNVPPTPANYAQRSGRAGRRGDPALVLTYCAARSGHDQYFFRRREAMVAGAVKSPQLDLGNEDLIKAHVYAVWLAKTGLPLGRSIADLLETEIEGFPLKEEIQAQVRLSDARLRECLEEARSVILACEPDISRERWCSGEWLEGLLRNAPQEFDRAFDRWRELYHAAQAQLREAHDLLYRSRRKEDQNKAKQQQEEALRQLNLLRNETGREESDFYPYRYLASEGFLPGYNFPRLPLRAFISREEGEFINRPRFLALSEFGPRNIIYHEGAKYEAYSLITPPGGLEQRRLRAKLCNLCGYFHKEDSGVDLCENCGSRLDASNSEIVPLLEMANVKTWRRERITCDEEERRREGYKLTSHFRFASLPGGRKRIQEAVVYDESGNPVLKLTYGPSATLYRINHGWRSRREEGFLIDLATGWWLRARDEEEVVEEPPVSPSVQRERVRLFVHDTRNILLISFLEPAWQNNEDFAATLQYALQRGIETTFQVEESELTSERIGAGEGRAVLFWEAAEGGVGVLRRLVEERDAFSQVAGAAIERCHFAPDTEKDGSCSRACYECLLSYTNQPDHQRLDRYLVREALMALSRSTTHLKSAGRPYEEHYRWLRSLTDSRSELERRLVDHLYRTKRRLPDDAQRKLADYQAIPDFFYEPNVCVFCDGVVHDEPPQREKDRVVRQELKELGYRVIAIRYDEDLEGQIHRYPDVFGEGG